MGHVLLGRLPDTVPWRKVITLVADGASVAAVAQGTLQAAIKGLHRAKTDPGLSEAVYLLTQIVLAARKPDFARGLQAADVDVPSSPNVVELVAAATAALERRSRSFAKRTDLGQMAQLCVGESLSALLGQRSATLFGTAPSDVRAAVYRLSTKAGFALLAHDFFRRFARRFLTYHLGRELPMHVGGNRRFASPGDHDAFVEQLDQHCRQVALIVRDYAGGWYSKQRFLGGISRAKARRFTAYAFQKLQAELRQRKERDDG